MVLGNIEESDYICSTPDGAGKSTEECMRRISRVICGDMDDYTIKIKKAALKMVEHLKINEGFTFTVDKTYPSHSGLGSGTQLSLAAGKLISKMNDLDLTASEIASIVGRGGTSGIGVAAFDKGGFIVDGGHNKAEKPGFLPSSASHASPPPIIARHGVK